VPLRYYLYISDAKVDMLLSQVDPTAKRKLATELSVDLKLFAAKRSSETVEGEDRIGRLEAVVKYLNDHDEIGTLDAPGRFFAGELPMRWGPYGDTGSALVYFGGITERAIVGLGGSSTHVLGGASGGEPVFSHSATPALLAALAGDEEAVPDTSALAPWTADDAGALKAVHLATSGLAGPTQGLEFVAKRLLHGPSPFPQRDAHDDMLVVLGSPLYVAMVD
jgi:hypothetical protein